jgi:hypothetical protein
LQATFDPEIPQVAKAPIGMTRLGGFLDAPEVRDRRHHPTITSHGALLTFQCRSDSRAVSRLIPHARRATPLLAFAGDVLDITVPRIARISVARGDVIGTRVRRSCGLGNRFRNRTSPRY